MAQRRRRNYFQMINALIELLIIIVVVGFVAGVVVRLLNRLPFPDARWRQIARVLVLVIAALIVFVRALPLLGVSRA